MAKLDEGLQINALRASLLHNRNHVYRAAMGVEQADDTLSRLRTSHVLRLYDL